MTPRRRGPGRPFPKGKSANPGGRPAVVKEVQALARQIVEDSNVLQEIDDLAKRTKDDRVRLAAWDMLLDRAYGRPGQAVKVERDDEPVTLIVDLFPAEPERGGDALPTAPDGPKEPRGLLSS